MRLEVQGSNGQALALLVFVLLLTVCFFSCTGNTGEIQIIPPPTNPLDRDFIGYGVVDESFVHVLAEPLQENNSLGYLRKRSLVKIMERQSVKNGANAENWVKVEAPYTGAPDDSIQGWLKESSLIIYDSEAQAQTAARIMNP
ncbi:MAG: hypothetical protein FWD78_04150 [Treponema sp.]|nr:hypothetical protein [Treponema sp.]